MPLADGNTQSIVSENIRELTHHGYKQRQAVAIALDHARKYPKQARGGLVPAFDTGGVPGSEAPWFQRQAARQMMQQPDSGFIHSSTAGRTDRLPVTPAVDSYVVPADVVSGLGQGNSLAGAHVLQETLKTGPWGTPLSGGHGGGSRMPRPHMPRTHMAKGGDAKTEILAAGGEFIVPVETVRRIGGGSVTKGHRILDDFVKRIRSHTIKTLRTLPGPKK